MESSSSNSEEMELQHMQLDERELHQKCLEWFKNLKKHLEFLHNTNNLPRRVYEIAFQIFFHDKKCLEWFKNLKKHLEFLHNTNSLPTRVYEIAFRIFFHEEHETFRMKTYHNLNQLQWQLERENLHSSNPKSCLDILRTPFKEFFDSKEVNALDFQNKCWQKHFKDYTGWEPETYKRILLRYLDELDKLIDERVLKYGELRMKEKEVQAIKEIEKRLQESEMQKQESLVSKGTTLEVCLVTNGESSSSQHESNSSRNEIKSSDNEISCSDGNDADADIGHPYDSDTVTEVPHSNNDTFENVFAHGIQNHDQPESIPDTYLVNENNSNIMSNIPNMDPNRDKEDQHDVDYEQQRTFFASLINNIKCDVEKCNKVNREAQQANALLTNELERYKKKEKYFSKDKSIESEYCKKINLLNDEISNLKSQASEKDKTFARENEKFDEYVQPILKRKNELENKNQEFLKQINDLENRLRKAGQTDQTIRMLLPMEDNV
ncbi:hypothetical protein Tco_0271090 [Tanacetum coccineum]